MGRAQVPRFRSQKRNFGLFAAAKNENTTNDAFSSLSSSQNLFVCLLAHPLVFLRCPRLPPPIGATCTRHQPMNSHLADQKTDTNYFLYSSWVPHTRFSEDPSSLTCWLLPPWALLCLLLLQSHGAQPSQPTQPFRPLPQRRRSSSRTSWPSTWRSTRYSC